MDSEAHVSRELLGCDGNVCSGTLEALDGRSAKDALAVGGELGGDELDLLRVDGGHLFGRPVEGGGDDGHNAVLEWGVGWV